MSVTEWLSKGWENYKSNVGTYIGLVVIAAIITGVVGFATFGQLIPTAYWGNIEQLLSAITVSKILSFTPTIIIGLLVISLVLLYFKAAILYTAREGADIETAFRMGAKYFLPLLAVNIILGIVVGIPPTILGLIAMAVPQATPVLLGIGLLISIYLGIRLITATGRIILDKGVGEALTEAWNTPIGKSFEVFVATLIVGIIGGIIGLIPVLGTLIEALVIVPWGAAVYMEAVKEVAK